MGELNCRCCWAKLDADSISFRLNVKEASDGLTLKDKLVQCIPEIKVTKMSEDVICVNCFALLTSAYNFRKMCLLTDEKLHRSEGAMEIVDASIAEAMPIEEEVNEDVHSISDESVNSENEESVGSELDCGVILNALPTKVLNTAINGNPILVCDRCESLFLRKEHYLSHDCEGASSCSKCHQCNVSFRSSAIYKMHMKFMHSQVCSTYKLNDTMKRKRSVTVSDVETKPRVSSNSNDNNSKMKIVSTPTKNTKKTVDSKKKKVAISPMAHKCTFCKKSFALLHHLQRHFRVHKVYCYRCVRCDRFEVNKDHHQKYTNCQCTDFAPPTFTDTRCPFCFKYYSTVPELQEHLNTHKNFKKYCFTCYMQFDSIWETALHHISSTCGTSQLVSKVVMKGNAISCPVCQKDFASKTNLLAHFRNHRANTMVCSKCEIPYYNPTAYMEHHKLCNKLEGEDGNGIFQVLIKEEARESFEDVASTSAAKEEPAVVEETIVSGGTLEQNEAVNIEKQETIVTGDSLEQNNGGTITTNQEPEDLRKNSEPESSETVEEMMVNIENIMNKVGEQLKQLTENRDDNAEIERAVNNATSLPETEDEAEMVTSTT